jgi:hypothetical protein
MGQTVVAGCATRFAIVAPRRHVGGKWFGASVTNLTLADLESAIRASWALDTCDDVDVDDWTPDNPARGQCGATTLVLHDLLGGQIADAEVRDGERVQGHHSWLRTSGGVDIDLTREQFSATEILGVPKFYARPRRRPRRCVEQYQRLHTRVYATLGIESDLATGEE